MLLVSCPSCHETVRVDPTLPDDTELGCPWCRERCSVADILHALPPMMTVISMGKQISQPEMASAFAAANSNSLPYASANPYLSGLRDDATEQPADWSVDNEGDFSDQVSTAELEPTDGTYDIDGSTEFTEQQDFESDQGDGEYLVDETGASENRESEFYVEYEAEDEQAADQRPVKSRRPRKEKSSIMSMIGVVAGGLLALPLAGGILYFVKPEALPSQVLDLFGKSSSKSNNVVARQSPPDMNRGNSFDANASMEDLAANKFGAMNPPAGTDAEPAAESSELSTLSDAASSADIADSLSAAVNPGASIPEMKMPDIAASNPVVPAPTAPALVIPGTSEAATANSTVAADPVPAATENAAGPVVDPKIIEPARQALAKYGELPTATPRDSAAAYIALANVAAKLPEGNALPDALTPLVAEVTANKSMMEHLPMIEKQWWTAGAAKMNVPGVIAVGKADADGIAFATESGLTLPIISETSLASSGRILIFGKIEGEGDARVVKVTGTHSLSSN